MMDEAWRKKRRRKENRILDYVGKLVGTMDEKWKENRRKRKISKTYLC